MDYFNHILYGVLMAYFGLISPGMLNMTALKIRINTGKTESLKFSFGAALVVFIQAGIALFFADYLVSNPKILDTLKIIAVFVFFVLSIFFFYLSRKELNSKATNQKGNFFLKGIGMSAINMLAIPFYLGISIYLTSIDKLIIEQPFIMLFVFGSGLGSFLIFYTYIQFAKIIIKRVSFIAKNINLILSLLFLILGIFTLIKVLP
jgi:threonine/homoserine/homoserine lactone efflux protein